MLLGTVPPFFRHGYLLREHYFSYNTSELHSFELFRDSTNPFLKQELNYKNTPQIQRSKEKITKNQRLLKYKK